MLKGRNGTGGLSNSKQVAVDHGVQALKAGILHIDTAQAYGTEEETGLAIKAAGLKRADIYVTSKSGFRGSESPANPLGGWGLGTGGAAHGAVSGSSKVKTEPEELKKCVQESVRKLGFIPNLMLIHSPFVPEEGKIGEFWTILEGLVKDGTLKGCSLGVSNFRPQDFEEVYKVCTIPPVVNRASTRRHSALTE